MYDTQEVVYRYLISIFGNNLVPEQKKSVQKMARLWVEQHPEESVTIDKALAALAPRNGAAFEELCQYVIAIGNKRNPRVPYRLEPFNGIPEAVGVIVFTAPAYF